MAVIIKTPRLELRELSLADAPFILELLNDAAFIQNIGDRGVRDLAGAEAYIRDRVVASYSEHGFGLWRTALRTNGVPIGICGLVKRPVFQEVEIGFAFLPGFRRQGYGYESSAAVLAYGQEQLGLAGLIAITSLDNAGSGALLEKLGFRFDRVVVFPENGEQVRLFIQKR